MNNAELVIRTVGTTAAVILSINLARATGAPLLGRVYGALLTLGVASYLPCSAGACMSAASIPAVLLSTGVPFFFWAWTRSIMDDDFRLTWIAIAAAAVLMLLPLGIGLFQSVDMWRIEKPRFGVIVHSLIGIAFVAAALIDVLRTWREDLIAARRRLRFLVLVVSGGYSITVLTVELFRRNSAPDATLEIVNATSLSILLLALNAALLSVSGGLREAFGWMPAIASPQPQVEPAGVAIRDVEQELVHKLRSAMTGKAAYRDANLSVASLANMVGAPEKRLREVINKKLGHKNFPSYVNAFRLEEVRTRLVDARNDRLPILTLALDAGFGSIVVFNRVFKERYAMTPTEYRNQRTAAAGNSAEINS